jgi:anti-sigma factor RsiW
MRCDEVIASLDAYLADELPSAKRAEIGAHVEACSDCRRVLNRARRLASLLAGTPAPSLPERFSERVLARARNRREQKAAAWSIRVWWLTFPAPMRAAAAAMLLAGAAIGIAFGWGAAPAPWSAASAQAEQDDSVLAGYGLDTLGDAPDGSLAGTYFALLDGRNGEGR